MGYRRSGKPLAAASASAAEADRAQPPQQHPALLLELPLLLLELPPLLLVRDPLGDQSDEAVGEALRHHSSRWPGFFCDPCELFFFAACELFFFAEDRSTAE